MGGKISFSPPPLPCGVAELTPQGKPSPVKRRGEWGKLVESVGVTSSKK